MQTQYVARQGTQYTTDAGYTLTAEPGEEHFITDAQQADERRRADLKKMQARTKALGSVAGFIGRDKFRCLSDLVRGEEGSFYIEKLADLGRLIANMPKTYEQDGRGDQALISLHYFQGNMDWFITEKDIETADEPGQHQAFGMVDLGHGDRELGYISIVELTRHNIELDLYYTPKTLAAQFAKP